MIFFYVFAFFFFSPFFFLFSDKRANHFIFNKMQSPIFYGKVRKNTLMLSMLGKNSQKAEFDISCKLSPQETICMKCQILLYGEKKTKKKNNLSPVEIFTQHAKRENVC